MLFMLCYLCYWCYLLISPDFYSSALISGLPPHIALSYLGRVISEITHSRHHTDTCLRSTTRHPQPLLLLYITHLYHNTTLLTTVLFQTIYKASIEEYYTNEKDEAVFFRDNEHTHHSFFRISGSLANEFNLEFPEVKIVKGDQYPGFNPFTRKASSYYISESIRTELMSSENSYPILQIAIGLAWLIGLLGLREGF